MSRINREGRDSLFVFAKVRTLGGLALDWAVTEAMQADREAATATGAEGAVDFHPSTSWAHGGPLIEHYRIKLSGVGERWSARAESAERYHYALGETALEASMRAIVMAVIGDDIDIPLEVASQ